MAVPALVSVADLATWLGMAISDTGRASALLDAAFILVRAETGRDWITDDDPLTLDTAAPELVADDLGVAETVIFQVVERKWRNTSGAVAETTGPFSVRFDPAAGQGLYLTETDKTMLAPYRASTRPSLWVQDTTRTGDDNPADTPTLFVDFGGEWFPYRVDNDTWPE